MITSVQPTDLSVYRPFDCLTDDERAEALNALTFERFEAGEVVMQRWTIPTHFFLVVEGVVEEHDLSGVVARYSTGDTFDAKALFDGRAEHTYVARENTRCYLLPAAIFNVLSRRNEAFRRYHHDSVSKKVDALIAVHQQREASAFLMERIGDGALHAPVYVDATQSLATAADAMKEAGESCVLVRKAGRLGIFTTRDVHEKGTLLGLPETTPVGDLASYDLITLGRDDFLFNSLVAMTRHEVRHIVITDADGIVGVLKQADLLRYLSKSSYFIADQVEHAVSEDEMREAGNAVPQLIKSLFERGAKPRYIARLVTDLNRKIFRHLFESIVPEDLRADACLLVLGSEGRGEQLMRTDQDNAIIFTREFPWDRLQPFLDAFTQALVELGYPRCPGEIMVCNPEWAKTRDGYRHDIARWMHSPDQKAFVNLAVFYDGSVISGETSLLDELKSYLVDLVSQQFTTLIYVARAIDNFPVPLTWLNRFVTEKTSSPRGALDLKKGGIFPIVHGVRCLALEHRVLEPSTVGRIQALAGRGPFDKAFSADMIEAFDFMGMLRLRRQIWQWEEGKPSDNFIWPNELNKLERGLLRESLRVVREFRSYIAYHYKLSMVS